MRLSEILSAVVVFGCVFFLAGYLLMPHLPPTPSRPVTVFEREYWLTNWVGLVLGIVAVAVNVALLKRSARSHR
ncbi:MAG TPA: hypothetical protein VHP11_12550 [Tepidisphaeraceae bacterium]|nr:hypothetical protein [Tepidisphaeraceae bacterium]